eukprot:m.72998 g.72998  ORF g.72998 m.72998 type:complete len:977 (-) comp24508_c0_seq1:61-2991(-)
MTGKVTKMFLGVNAPGGYVPGLGRGASGFTTRSDIGPARESDMELPSEQDVAQAARKMKQKDGDDDDVNLNDTNYDEFSGYGGSLFKGGAYDDDDKEADQIYDAIEERQDEKRKTHREKTQKALIMKFRKERPKIQQQFADLKRQLNEVSAEEWGNLPDVADIGKKVKKRRHDRLSMAPDSFLGGGQNSMTALHTATEHGTSTAFPGTSTAFPGTSTAFPGTATAFPGTATAYGTQTAYPGTGTAYPGTGTAYPGTGTAYPGMSTAQPGYGGQMNLGEIGHARKTMMGVKLDQAADSVTGQTVVDAKGYLTDLNSITPKNLGNIGDVKRGRLLLKSVRSTNPKHAPAWIASAGLEAVTGKMQAARNLIMKGTEACPQSEEIWLEAIKLMPPEQQRSVAAQAINACQNSVDLWIKACSLESDKKSKRIVLRKALETVPTSVRLWKAAVDLEESNDAKILLSRAVECCPLSIELWLALAHLEDYEDARKVLNRARKAIPTDRSIWITAARLEEAVGKVANVGNMIRAGVKSLRTNGVEINRDEWIKEAEAAEKIASIETAQSIVREVLGEGIEDEDRKNQWLEDAETCVTHESFACARAVYAHMISHFKADESIWLRAAYFEKDHGTQAQLNEHVQAAVRFCPQCEVLWLMGAKSQWQAGDVTAARQILSQAFSANPNSEEIWLSAVKLESETNEIERAQKLLTNARQQANTARVWMKSVRLEWVLGNLDEAKTLLEQAVKDHEHEAKLWMMRGQIEEQQGNTDAAREMYTRGRKLNKNNFELWLLAARVEVKAGNYTRARSILEKARTTIPKTPEFWLEGCRVEAAAGFKENSKNLMAKALQECPDSGLLWSHAIFMEGKPQRKTKSVDALKKCENNPQVLLAVARLFLSERKIAKARSWFNRTVKLDPDYGDAWAAYYKFEQAHGSEEKAEVVAKHCLNAEPRHGEQWQDVRKRVRNWKMSIREVLEICARETEAY